jgi:hypothetical protein
VLLHFCALAVPTIISVHPLQFSTRQPDFLVRQLQGGDGHSWLPGTSLDGPQKLSCNLCCTGLCDDIDVADLSSSCGLIASRLTATL